MARVTEQVKRWKPSSVYCARGIPTNGLSSQPVVGGTCNQLPAITRIRFVSLLFCIWLPISSFFPIQAKEAQVPSAQQLCGANVFGGKPGRPSSRPLQFTSEATTAVGPKTLFTRWAKKYVYPPKPCHFTLNHIIWHPILLVLSPFLRSLTT